MADTPSPAAPTPLAPFDPTYQRHPSRRYPVYARGGMVNCSSPQAAAAGLEALRAGGTAVDAAVAAASALTVVEPTANGIGSDAFALVWSARDQKLYGLNSSGPAPAAISIERVLADGRAEDGKMPKLGWTPVTVSGAPGAWAALTKRFGRRSLADNLAPAVRYAREGYPCAPNLSLMWQRSFDKYAPLAGEDAFAEWFVTFAPQGRAPLAGELVTLPHHADTLEAIGATDAAAFYSGDIARAIDADSRAHGGYLRYEDLAAFEPQWVEPLSVDYHGYTVCEIPPNGQGIAALMALGTLEALDGLGGPLAAPGGSLAFGGSGRTDSIEPDLALHRQIEAMKLAFADAFAHVTDPTRMDVDPHELLTPELCARRAARISEHAQDFGPTLPPHSNTVYLCCADAEGNMVSYIQSNYMGFGSGIVVRGTGVALQNRGHDFSLDPTAANALAPGKRTYHTIIPGFLMRDGRPVGPFGVMGGYMQPQGHVQVVCNYVDGRLDPQQALDAPRWQWLRDGSLIVEDRFDAELARKLARRGHRVRVELDTSEFGRGQMIVRLDNDTLVGGCESRTDSLIACW
ncbi:MAG: gamma-glutamyltransferase family protein [Coriobacteriia bacterium]|nr:gamma-glutamyltransferase family protein [Coriobacteriia bacterium]